MEIELSARHWWAFAIRGVVAILFGILAFALPGLTLTVLVLLWGAFALIDGAFALVSAVRTEHHHRWGLLAEGIVAVLLPGFGERRHAVGVA